MGFRDEPSAEELTEWFSKVKLHKDMEHDRYIGGIVVIENRQTNQWNPFPLAGTRVAYFWDWCDANSYVAHIINKPPQFVELPFKKGEGEDKYALAPAMYVETTVNVYKPHEVVSAGDNLGILVRTATARKTVDPGQSRAIWENRRKTGTKKVPDFDAVMKAETGALARAVAMLGMLTLPGSGIASAEDMHEFMRAEAAEASAEVAGGAEGGAGDAPEPAARGGRAANPKRAVPAADA